MDSAAATAGAVEMVDGESSTAVAPSADAALVEQGAAASLADDVLDSPDVTQKKKQLDVLYGSSLDDVELGAATNCQRGTTMTRIRSINGVAVADLRANIIRNWTVSVGIQCKKSFKKEDICAAIVSTIAVRERLTTVGPTTALQQPNLSTLDNNDTTMRVAVNHVRFINVLSDDTIKGQLVLRGQQKTRRDLDNGIDPDSALFVSIADSYNDGTDDTLLQLKWVINWNGALPDASSFVPIIADRAKVAFKDLCSKYDVAVTNWKKSGWHDDIPISPFKDYVGSSMYLLYLHQFVQENPGLLHNICASLPPDGFNEGKERPSKRARQSAPRRDENMAAIAAAQQEKASSVSYMTHQSAYNDLEEKVLSAKTRRRALFGELKKLPEFVGKSSRYLKRFIEMIEGRLSNTNNKRGPSTIEESSDEDDYIFSQGSINSGDTFDDRRMIAEEIVECNQSIKSKEQQMVLLKEKIEEYLSTQKAVSL